MEAIALAALSLGAIGGVLTLALKALASERRAGEQKARADMAEVNQTSLAAMLADEKNRGDRLEDANATLLAELAGLDANGSFGRLLKVLGSSKTASDFGPRAVHREGDAGPAPHHDTDLEVP